MSKMVPDEKNECVKVMVRCRPMNRKELDNGSKTCVEIDGSVNQVIIKSDRDDGDAGRAFTYDAVYDQ